MKLYWVRGFFIVLVRCPVHTPVSTPMYGLPLNQSDQRIRSVFWSVYSEGGIFTFFQRNLLKLNQLPLDNQISMKLSKEYLHVNILKVKREFFYMYSQSKDMEFLKPFLGRIWLVRNLLKNC